MAPSCQLWKRPGPRRLCRALWSGAARSSASRALEAEPGPPARPVLPYDAIPRSGRSAWFNLYRFWRSDSFQRLHLVMERNFQRYGPIYRETVGAYNTVNVLLPQDAAQLFRSEGIFPRRMGIESWAAHRRLRNHKCGLFLLNGEDWRSDRLVLNKEVISPAGTRKFLPLLDAVARDFVSLLQQRVRKSTRGSLTIDLYADLFCFTLEASSYALYGERLGLLEESPDAESQRFIGGVETMLRTTLPLLFLPPSLARWTNAPLWREHMAAWDIIFKHADKCIQNIYQEFCLGQPRKYSGIMAELLLQAEMPLDAIKANMTEFTAGSVDTALPGGHNSAALSDHRRGAPELQRASWDPVPGGAVRHGPEPRGVQQPRALRPHALAEQGGQQLQGPGLRLRGPAVHRPPPGRSRNDAVRDACPAQLHHRHRVQGGY
ncbi:cytochrome P450 11B, mitochondrial-like isoform X3 [Carettochelys insculpta]|uniref:cytochrome P450 11B, mitochondrial-like isoform X3 n=1 Tax=Carettochelys insculpta TaxID=44489 RepID=UPI003EBF4E94